MSILTFYVSNLVPLCNIFSDENGDPLTEKLDGENDEKPDDDLENAEEEEGAFGGPKPMVPFSSLFILSPTNPLRVLIHTLVCTKYFEMAVMLVILLSSISLAAENPVDEKAFVNVILYYTDFVFTSVFTVELVLKVNCLKTVSGVKNVYILFYYSGPRPRSHLASWIFW